MKLIFSILATVAFLFVSINSHANGSFYRPGQLPTAEQESQEYEVAAIGAETPQCPFCQPQCAEGDTGSGCIRAANLGSPLTAGQVEKISPAGDDKAVGN